MSATGQSFMPFEKQVKSQSQRKDIRITIRPDPLDALAPLKEKLEARVADVEQTDPPEPGINLKDMHQYKRFIRSNTVMPVPLHSEREWLAEMLQHGKTGRYIIPEKAVTPGLAVALLELNTKNRNISERNIRMHQDTLQRGEHPLTHQGMAVDWNDALVDGQHRLLAIIRSGVTMQCMISFGVDPKERKFPDMGKKRSPGDSISLSTDDSPVLRASMARIVLRAESGIDRPDQLMVVERAQRMIDSEDAEQSIRMGWKMSNVCEPSAAAAAHYWINTYSPNAARIEEFFEYLPTGEGLVGVKLILRESLRNKKLGKIKMPGNESFFHTACFILAWNAWLKGNKKVSMDWRTLNELPEVK